MATQRALGSSAASSPITVRLRSPPTDVDRSLATLVYNPQELLASPQKVAATFCNLPEGDRGIAVPASQGLASHYRAYDVDGRRKDGIVTTKRVCLVQTVIRFRATVEVREVAA